MPRLNKAQVKQILVGCGFERKRMGGGTLDFDAKFYEAAKKIQQAFCSHPGWVVHQETGAEFCAECGVAKQ